MDAQSDKAPPPSANEVTPALRRLREQNELLRTKLFQLQRALIASGTLHGHAEVGHLLAEVVPEERRLRGSSRITLTFGGMNQSLSMPPVEFLRSLIERGTDVIFYKDFNQCWYHRGLLGVSEDVPSPWPISGVSSTSGRPGRCSASAPAPAGSPRSYSGCCWTPDTSPPSPRRPR